MNKKVFLINFSSPMQIEIGLALAQKSVDIDYWVGGKKYFDAFVKENPLPNTIFHNFHEAVLARPADGIDDGFSPVSRDVLNKLFKCESQIISMMNRINFTNISIDQQKHLYYEQVRYWYGILNKYKPDVVIFADIPHTVFNLVIYHVAKLLGIKTLLYKRSNGVPNRLIFFDDFEKYSELEKSFQGLKDKDIKLEDLSEDIVSYYQKQINPSEIHTPFRKGMYLSDKSKPTAVLPSGQAIIKNIKNLKFFRVTWSYIKLLFRKNRILALEDYRPVELKMKYHNFRWNRLKDKFRDEYLKLQVEPNWEKKFVYVPLHLQPECSTNPMGDVFNDQILMIQMLAKALPKDWVVYIKENPVQWKWSRAEVGRYLGYYNDLVKIKNVFLLPTQTSTFDLINKSQAVATVAGTAGWESLIRSKPVLVFGYVWYMHCDGCFRVSSVEECKNAVEDIQNKKEISQTSIVKYLMAVERESLLGYPKEKYHVESTVSREDNVKIISNELFNKIN